jgi:hypothetical protein
MSGITIITIEYCLIKSTIFSFFLIYKWQRLTLHNKLGKLHYEIIDSNFDFSLNKFFISKSYEI